ncbi:transposase [uncultured Halopseudomonas sp.]|uniref:transposase n=1 Tax=uncultured Halopseudomonas sp. TaxID=2901193 RepID=UPI0030EF7F58|tara:strand:+ start:1492 stop:1863 length:372 start_codon:yes stop_codon:yes gene_type:complete
MDYDAPLSDVTPTPKKRRRRYSAAFKAQILAECDHPGASVAGVAIRHSLNPNMVQKWRLVQRRDSQDDFLRLPAPSPPASQAGTLDDSATIRLEVPTSSGRLIVHWPLNAIERSVDWLRAVTR